MRDGCAFTSRLFTFPFLAIQRKWPAIIGIVATRKAKARRTVTPPVAAWLSPWANDRVISANQIGDCLTPEQRRDRQEAEGDAPRTNLLSRRALICISKSNARAVGIVPISSLTGTYSLRNTSIVYTVSNTELLTLNKKCL